MSINYLDYFPENYTPTKQQEYILNEITKAKELGYKFIIISAPTGSGKTHVGMSVARAAVKPDKNYKKSIDLELFDDVNIEEILSDPDTYCVGSYCLTVTKVLQHQYKDLFEEYPLLKGKSNYECTAADGLPCDLAPCVIENSKKQEKLCRVNKSCPYIESRKNAICSQTAYLNYAMYFSLPTVYRARDVIICDEASELEDTIVNLNSININLKTLKKIGIHPSPLPSPNAPYSAYNSWLKSLKVDIDDLRGDYILRIKQSKKLNESDKIKTRYLRLLSESLNSLIALHEETEFITEFKDDCITFKPYKIDSLARKYFKVINTVILMSATIIDHKNFAKQLGINSNEYYYIESPSIFDPKKAPIKLGTQFKLNYSNKAKVLPEITKAAEFICKEVHPNEKGIIHTHTNDITEYISKSFTKNSRYLFRNNKKINEELINIHFNSSKPTVLVSPSMTHGVDLKGDNGRFAIIMKAPFMPLGDKRIKRLCDEDPDWYINKMISTFIQMCGRTIRSINDESITYVLDATLSNKLIENKDKIPKYFWDRLE